MHAIEYAKQKLNDINYKISKCKFHDKDIRTKISKKQEVVDDLHCRIRGIRKENSEVGEIDSAVIKEISGVHDVEWKNLYKEVSKDDTLTSKNTEGSNRNMNAAVADYLSKALKLGEVVAKNIILTEQIK